MCEVFEEGIRLARENHTPVLFHVEEITQPQGHSTSGSHERYKSSERLEWEKEWDCIKKMKEWLIENDLANMDELTEIEAGAKEFVRGSRNRAWEQYIAPIKEQVAGAVRLIRESVVNDMEVYTHLQKLANDLQSNKEPLRRDVLRTVSLAIEAAPHSPSTEELEYLYNDLVHTNRKMYNSHLYNEGPKSALHVAAVKAFVSFDAPMVNGYEVLNKYFDALFAQNPDIYAFGEDVGHIGDVNQGFAGL